MEQVANVMAFHAAGYNPRLMSEYAMRGLRKSLHTFGDLSGFVWNAATGNIVCAHQRREALMGEPLTDIEWGDTYEVELGDDSARFVSVERMGWFEASGGARYTVRRVEWPDAFEKAANVTANDTRWHGVFDDGKLRIVLETISDEAPELSDTFTLSGLVSEQAEADEKDVHEADDLAPELPDVALSEPGRLYRLGEHLLLCGDAMDLGTLTGIIDHASVDMVFTDPPYNMDYRSKTLGGIANDALDDAAFVRLILASCNTMKVLLKSGGSYYICMGTAAYALVANQMRKVGMEHRLILWAKPSIGLGSQDYRPQVELLLYGVNGKKCARTWRGGRSESDLWTFDASLGVVAFREEGAAVLEFSDGTSTTRVAIDGDIRGGIVIREDGSTSDVWKCGRESAAYVHPTQKPLALVERAIRNSSAPGHLVFDPFGGSGTTLIACQRLGRRCLTVELDPKYADVIRRRWAIHAFGAVCDWERETPEISRTA